MARIMPKMNSLRLLMTVNGSLDAANTPMDVMSTTPITTAIWMIILRLFRPLYELREFSYFTDTFFAFISIYLIFQ